MGIDKLNPFLYANAPDAFKITALDDLRDYRLAIDANGYFKTNISIVYRTYVNAMTDPSEEIDREAIINRLIEQAFMLYKKMSRYGITLVMVWDGAPLAAKTDCLKKR